MTGFGSFHPMVLFLYYILVVGCTMVSMHPVLAGISLVGGFLLYGAQNGWRKLFSELGFSIGLFLMLAVTNPMFVHNGETVLFFLNDNPVTLEAILYGMVSSTVLIGVLLWCQCYSRLLTTDKFLYLFGRLIPKLGLILSMAFRFIPLFRLQIGKINQSQKTMGLYTSDSVTDRIGGGLRVFDSLISWSLENSVDTADAMIARGYGLPGRTNFSLFRFRRRDGLMLGGMGLLSLLTLAGFLSGGYAFYYYPTVAGLRRDGLAWAFYMAAAGFFWLPGLYEIGEQILWRKRTAKIGKIREKSHGIAEG